MNILSKKCSYKDYPFSNMYRLYLVEKQYLPQLNSTYLFQPALQKTGFKRNSITIKILSAMTQWLYLAKVILLRSLRVTGH